jgi:hypothetical protein
VKLKVDGAHLYVYERMPDYISPCGRRRFVGNHILKFKVRIPWRKLKERK